MKIAITGGHLAPALSVIEVLPRDAEILYIGRKHALEGDSAVSLEYEVITQKGISFAVLQTGRLQRSITRYTIPSIAKVPLGFARAVLILRKFNPDVVVGFGSYVSFPVILAAKALKIPVVIHEQTLDVGITNKAVARFAKKICISFESSRKYFPKDKVILTGNPLRKSILSPKKKFEVVGKDPVIYITGGSLGSHAINALVEKSLNLLLNKYIIIHQTGSSFQFKDFEKMVILKQGLNNDKRNRYVVTKYFLPEEIGEILKVSRLVVSRAGINSVSELITLQKPSLLIPLPNSQKNEQAKNAELLKSLGLGEVKEQSDLTPQDFLLTIDQMIKNIDKYKLSLKQIPFPKDAAQKIVEIIYAAKKNSN